MDLLTVEEWVAATERDDLRPLTEASAAAVAGGTWLFADRRPHLRTLVDLTTMGWEPVATTGTGIEIAATCSIATLLTLAPRWPALAELAPRCAGALASSPKVWDHATVGGNVCVGLPAGAMTTLLVALDAVATVWRPDATTYDVPVRDLVIGVATTALGRGEVVRSFAIGHPALQARVAFRRVSLAVQGRSGTIVVARRDEAGAAPVVTVTAGTTRPHRFVGDADLDRQLDGIDDWLVDHHGSPAWREAMTRRMVPDAVAAVA